MLRKSIENELLNKVFKSLRTDTQVIKVHINRFD